MGSQTLPERIPRGTMSQSSDRVDRRVWVIAAACGCGPLMSGLDSTMINVSLDTLSSAFPRPDKDHQWVTSGYQLALRAVVAGERLAGRSRPGTKRIFLGCFAGFIRVLGAERVRHLDPQSADPVPRAARVIAGGLLAPMMQNDEWRGTPDATWRASIGVAAMPVMVGQMFGRASEV